MTSTHLGPYSDLIEAVRQSHRQPPQQDELLRHLDFWPWRPEAREPRLEQKWQADGIQAEEISWSCGYGPRTHAWLFYPDKIASPRRPALVLLHDHGGYKYWGKEKVADGPGGRAAGLDEFRREFYDECTVATELAQAGFTVLVHDTFLWGSRRVPLEIMPEGDRDWATKVFQEQCRLGDKNALGLPEEIGIYNLAAIQHENIMAKYAAVLGTTLAGIANFDDLVAVEYLKSRTDVCGGWIGCIGLSGGGMRSALLRGSCESINAGVIVAAMSSYSGLLDKYVIWHTWLLYLPSLARRGDWPDVVARRFQAPVLVQYALEDQIFSREGMAEADQKIRAAFDQSAHPNNYRAEFYPVPHKFDTTMQKAAIGWLQGMAMSAKDFS